MYMKSPCILWNVHLSSSVVCLVLVLDFRRSLWQQGGYPFRFATKDVRMTFVDVIGENSISSSITISFSYMLYMCASKMCVCICISATDVHFFGEKISCPVLYEKQQILLQFSSSGWQSSSSWEQFFRYSHKKGFPCSFALFNFFECLLRIFEISVGYKYMKFIKWIGIVHS